MPEEDLAACNGDDRSAVPIGVPKIVEYLKAGGLTSLLRKNCALIPKHIRGWLLQDWLGNLTYTFAEERGRVGGQLIPAKALYDNRIHFAKRAEVAEYLRGFGLNEAQAADVIAEVGTAPQAATRRRKHA